LGTVLNAGLNQLLNITFAPNDAANYTTTSATTSINVIGVPDAHFRINQTQGTVPPDVQFTDKTTGSPTEWYWVFGDGTTSNLQNPEYTYTTLGNYLPGKKSTRLGAYRQKSDEQNDFSDPYRSIL
jgi:PKD repeat protein